MIDLKILRNNFEKINEALKNRNNDLNLHEISELEDYCRKLNSEIESLNSIKNQNAKNVSDAIKNNDNFRTDFLKKEIVSTSLKLEKLNEDFFSKKNKLDNLLLLIPNIPDESVPLGNNENENIKIRSFGQIPKFNFNVKSHWEIGNNLNIIDLEKASLITGTRFSIYKNKGSQLLRALESLTLEVMNKNGFEEYTLPVIVNEKSLINTGQLPVLKDDVFQLNYRNYYLSPTLEVQLTNLFQNTIIDSKKLPFKVTSSSLNFRLEAGSAGKDVKGLIRQHQFRKTEMVIISHPNDSFNQLEKMVNCAEEILQLLNLPYQVIELCTGDLGFCSAKTYDIEVYLPSFGKYREISSCSNCIDFQSRRAKIRFKNNGKNELVHTLNGTGLSLDRLWVAIIENYQQEDGSINMPLELKKYLNFEKITKNEI